MNWFNLFDFGSWIEILPRLPILYLSVIIEFKAKYPLSKFAILVIRFEPYWHWKWTKMVYNGPLMAQFNTFYLRAKPGTKASALIFRKLYNVTSHDVFGISQQSLCFSVLFSACSDRPQTEIDGVIQIKIIIYSQCSPFETRATRFQFHYCKEQFARFFFWFIVADLNYRKKRNFLVDWVFEFFVVLLKNGNSF